MTILSAFRRRSAVEQSPAPSAAAPTAAPVPFDGYERLSDRQVMLSLSKHSQVELTAIDGYERANKARIAVLNKLRYMRGNEPMAGYDELSSTDVVSTLETADMATIKLIRAYERKFANRPDVLEQVVRVHHRTLEHEPAPHASGYQAPKLSSKGPTAAASTTSQ